jgi:hypothetical protein
MLLKKIGLLSALVIVALSIAGVSAPAQATPRTPLALWAMGLNSPNVLFSVNPATGAATAVGTGTGISQGMGAAVDLTTGLVYVMNYGCDLFTIDVATGIATSTGHNLSTVIAGQRTYCDAMTIGRDGVGYVSAHNVNGEPYFLSFNPSTGVTTQVGPMMNAYYDWLAFDPSSGFLYGQNDDSGDLYSMDPASGIETRVGLFSASDPFNPWSHGVVIVGDGTFFAQERNSLAAGDTTSWTGATIGSYGDPLNSVGDGSLLLFTTTDLYVVDPIVDPVSDPVVVSALASTGLDARGLFTLAGIALALLFSGAGAFFMRQRTRRAVD